MQDKLLCIYHSLQHQQLPQIINTIKRTKTACRIVDQSVNRKILQFYKGYFNFIIYYQIKALEIKYFCKVLRKFCKFSLIIKDI